MRAPAGHGLPSVSVVIPARDDAVALRTCLTLLARQHVRADRFLNGKGSDVAARILGAGHTNIFLFDTLELVDEQVDTVLRDHAMFAADHAAGAFAEIAEE